MDITRDFLSKVLPWASAAEGVWFNLHWRAPLSNPKPGRTHYWDGRAYSTIEELTKGVAVWGRGEADLYICMSSQSRFEEVTARTTGNKYKKAIRFQANVVSLQSFYVDIDVKPEAYPTQQEAFGALKLFMDACDMPMPTAVVGSGSGGFHVHWVVERPLTIQEWQPLANALAHATQSFGLICDTQCTIDSARILRIPGTNNFKSSPAKPVTLISSGDYVQLEDLQEVLAPYIGLTPIGNNDFQAFPFPRREPTIEGAELGAGIVVYDAPRPSIMAVGDACPWIQDTLETSGEDNANPLWHMSLNVAAFTEEGRDAAHLLSSGHVDYSYEDTEDQYERVERTHKEKNIGWPQCSKINITGAPQCKLCPNLKLNRSPFNFVSAPAPVLAGAIALAGATPAPDVLPDKYTRAADGLIYSKLEGEDGQIMQMKVCPYPMSHGWLQDSPWVLHFTAVTGASKIIKVSIPTTDFFGMGGTRKILSTQGLVLNDKEAKSTQEFLVAWTQKLQTQKNSVVSSAPFGWTKTEGSNAIEGFTYAGRMWGDGTDRPAAQADPELADNYSPHGELAPWLEASKLITNQKRPALDVILATAFAAPLMYVVGHSGALVAAYSKSGVGKSAALVTALAVWGHGTRAKQGLTDTTNMLFGKMGRLKHLPVYWDEIQQLKQMQTFAANIFQLTSGIEKGRMNKDLSLAIRGDWRTLLVSCANYSLMDPIVSANKSHTAGLMRLFEYQVEAVAKNAPGRIEIGRATRIIGALDDNYGHAGLIYSQFLGAQHARIKKEVSETHDALDKELGADEAERFWTAVIAINICGARYANELGLTDIDIPAMSKFMKNVFHQLRSNVKDSPADMGNKISIANVLAQFLGAMRARNTMVTNRINVGAGRPMKGAIKVLNDASHLDTLFVQVGRDDKMLRFSATYIRSWLDKNGHPKQGFLKALEEEFGFKVVNGIIGSGTSFSTGVKEYLYEVSYDSPKLLGFMDIET